MHTHTHTHARTHARTHALARAHARTHAHTERNGTGFLSLQIFGIIPFVFGSCGTVSKLVFVYLAFNFIFWTCMHVSLFSLAVPGPVPRFPRSCKKKPVAQVPPLRPSQGSSLSIRNPCEPVWPSGKALGW